MPGPTGYFDATKPILPLTSPPAASPDDWYSGFDVPAGAYGNTPVPTVAQGAYLPTNMDSYLAQAGISESDPNYAALSALEREYRTNNPELYSNPNSSFFDFLQQRNPALAATFPRNAATESYDQRMRLLASQGSQRYQTLQDQMASEKAGLGPGQLAALGIGGASLAGLFAGGAAAGGMGGGVSGGGATGAGSITIPAATGGATAAPAAAAGGGMFGVGGGAYNAFLPAIGGGTLAPGAGVLAAGGTAQAASAGGGIFSRLGGALGFGQGNPLDTASNVAGLLGAAGAATGGNALSDLLGFTNRDAENAIRSAQFGDVNAMQGNILGLMRQQAQPYEQQAFQGINQSLFSRGRLGLDDSATGEAYRQFSRGLGEADVSRQLAAYQYALQQEVARTNAQLGVGSNLVGLGQTTTSPLDWYGAYRAGRGG